jgi:hypothetical protein
VIRSTRELFDLASVKDSFKYTFQNSIGFTQREYGFAIFERQQVRSIGFLGRPIWLLKYYEQLSARFVEGVFRIAVCRFHN